MLFSPMLHSRVGIWIFALTKFSLHYVPAKAIKGQVLANFLVDHPCANIKQNPIGNPVNFVELKPWKLFFDAY